MASTTILTVTGTPTVFLPLPTAWPSKTNCESNIYYAQIANTYLAWDPVYGRDIVSSAQSCLPPQVTNWWNQATAADPITALGPTFQCPEAYTPMQTAIIASSLLQTFCCPPAYTFNQAQPNKPGSFPLQCMSTINPQQTVTYLVKPNAANELVSTGTLVSTSAIVYAIPVNGFNLSPNLNSPNNASSATTTSQSLSATNTDSASLALPPTTTAPTSMPTSLPIPAGYVSAGTAAGIGIGVAAGILLLALAAFMVWRRRSHARWRAQTLAELPVYSNGGGSGTPDTPAMTSTAGMTSTVGGMSPGSSVEPKIHQPAWRVHSPPPQEMSPEEPPHELGGSF